MNLPYITAQIGKSIVERDGPLEMLYEQLQEDDRNTIYDVFLNFDLEKGLIYFAEKIPHSRQSAKQYMYFGNNKAAEFQYHITRDAKNFKYILKNMLGDLVLEMEQQQMEDTELYGILKLLEKEGFFINSQGKSERRINIEKFADAETFNRIGLEILDDKNISVGGEKMSFEKFASRMNGMEGPGSKVGLVIPRVVTKDEQEIVLSMTEDYKSLVMKSKKLEDMGDNNKSTGKGKTCFICGKEKNDIKCSEYMNKLSRSGINKIFTTTTINSARNIDGKKYVDNYSICPECYIHLLSGERYINRNFTARIAGERAFVILYGLLGDFNFEYVQKLKSEVDMCFNPNEVEDFMKGIDAEFKMENEDYNYNLNLIVNRTDGNSVGILEVIEDIPVFHFQRVNEALKKSAARYKEYIKGLSMGSLYHMIHIKKNKNGEHLDIKKLLSIYKSILDKRKIETAILFDYAVEAIGIEIRKEREFDARRCVFEYIALFRGLSDLGLLDKKLFEGGNEKVEKKENSDLLQNTKYFLDEEGFGKQAKALFYLGALVKMVANAQYSGDHKKKPILRKIQFQGMGKKEVLQLYSDIVEKLRQYDKMTLLNENIMKEFHVNFGRPDAEWNHSDMENVFYIMSGYAFMTRTYEERSNQADTGSETQRGDD